MGVNAMEHHLHPRKKKRRVHFSVARIDVKCHGPCSSSPSRPMFVCRLRRRPVKWIIFTGRLEERTKKSKKHLQKMVSTIPAWTRRFLLHFKRAFSVFKTDKNNPPVPHHFVALKKQVKQCQYKDVQIMWQMVQDKSTGSHYLPRSSSADRINVAECSAKAATECTYSSAGTSTIARSGSVPSFRGPWSDLFVECR